jgi:F0F1-type ATP synthase membrane subunit a
MFYLAASTAAEHGPGGAKPLFTYDAPDAHTMIFIFWTWVAMAIIVAFALAARGSIGIIPRAWAGVFEHIYDWILDLSHSMMGPAGKRYVPFVMTIFLFVLVSNWMGLIPFPQIHQTEHPGQGDVVVMKQAPHIGHWEFHEILLEAPTGNIHTTLALALISFMAFNIYGLQKHYERARSGGHSHHGHGDHDHDHAHPTVDPFTAAIKGFGTWLLHFIEPTPTLWRSLDGPLRYILVPILLVLFLGLNIIEEFARIISLTIRLFGNIFGEHQVKVGLFAAMGMFAGGAMTAAKTAAAGAALGNGMLAVLLWGSSVFVTLIGTLAGFIQAFIFMVLTLSYIAHVVAEEH